MKNKTYKKKIDRNFFKEREKVSKLFNNNFHRIIYSLVIVFFITSCSSNNKKNFTTYGTALGVGGASWTLFKSYLGKSGTSGNIPTVIAVTSLGTILGFYLGSEISENVWGPEETQIIQASLESDEETISEWTKQTDNGKVETLKVEQLQTFQKQDDNRKCKEFSVTVNREGVISQSTGVACQNSNGDYKTLGSDIL